MEPLIDVKKVGSYFVYVLEMPGQKTIKFMLDEITYRRLRQAEDRSETQIQVPLTIPLALAQ